MRSLRTLVPLLMLLVSTNEILSQETFQWGAWMKGKLYPSTADSSKGQPSEGIWSGYQPTENNLTAPEKTNLSENQPTTNTGKDEIAKENFPDNKPTEDNPTDSYTAKRNFSDSQTTEDGRRDTHAAHENVSDNYTTPYNWADQFSTEVNWSVNHPIQDNLPDVRPAEENHNYHAEVNAPEQVLTERTWAEPPSEREPETQIHSDQGRAMDTTVDASKPETISYGENLAGPVPLPEAAANSIYPTAPLLETAFTPSLGDFQLSFCHLLFGAAWGNFIGFKKGYSELGIFAAAANRANTHIFFDGREFNLAKDRWAGSLGLGFRIPLCCCSYILGANVYYDYLQAKLSHCSEESRCRNRAFNRVGVGVEFLSSCFDLRINGYIPVGKRERMGEPLEIVFFDGLHAELRHGKVLNWGIDAEIGIPIFQNNQFSSYLAVGGYYYAHMRSKHIYGPQARLELWWQRYVSVELWYSYDQRYQSQYLGKVFFNIPLEELCNCFCGEVCCDSLKKLVRRNYIPFLEDKCCASFHW